MPDDAPRDAAARDASEPAADGAGSAPNDAADGRRGVRKQLGYLASLPERTLRTGTGLLGGVVREGAEVIVPRSFQTSRTYELMVAQMLDFLVHDVGRVVAAADKPSSTSEVDNYVARKAVGNFVDLAALATLHVSPLMVLAAISDLAHGSHVYLEELADELKAQGVIDQQSRIRHVNDLLSAVSETSALTSKAFNTPPLSVEALQATIDETRSAIRAAGNDQVLSPAEVDRMWNEMRAIADREGVNLLAVSGAATMHSLGRLGSLGRGALSSVKVAGSLLDRHVFDHYQQAFAEIREKGLYQSLAETSRPYVAAVWENFQSTKPTLTEDLLSGKLLGNAWRAVRRWVVPTSKPSATEFAKLDESAPTKSRPLDP